MRKPKGDDITMYIFFLGLFLFLLGLDGCKRGFNKLASTQIESILKVLTDNVYLSIFVGIIVTGVLQSSSGVTVIIISLIEAGLLELKPALALVLGANIGTTLTIQIISLPILTIYPYLIIMGIFFMILGLVRKRIFLGFGLVLSSFGVVFAGLRIMNGCFQNPATNRLISRILAFSGENYLLGILLGIIVAGIIQSSSAVTGITLSLARSNLISLPIAIAIALGSNIGTCITAFLASFNCRKTARNLAWGHFFFNLIGVLVILPFLSYFNNLVALTSQSLVRQIANAHTLFNLFNVILFLPLLNTFVSFLGGATNGND